MIIVASQRSGGQALARHLMNADDNEHVTVHDIRGTVSETVAGAFKEMQAVAKGTKCKKYLLSVSLNPPANEIVDITVFENAIERIEAELGLKGQPRAVVLHEKDARRHCHCVWSRIDGENMKSIKFDYFKKRLNGIAKELYLEQAWDMPQGFVHPHLRNPFNFTLAEWQQGKRNNVDPREIKQALQQCWQSSDNQTSFQHAIEDKGFFLAKGDKRGFVVMDWRGEIYSLSRSLDIKSKAINAKLGQPNNLRSVADTQTHIASRYDALHKRFSTKIDVKHQFILKPLLDKQHAMLAEHRQARLKQQAEHEQRWLVEQSKRQAKIRKGVSGLWDFITGKSNRQRKINEAEAEASLKRDKSEKEVLVQKQLQAARTLREQLRNLRNQRQQEKSVFNQTFNARMNEDIRVRFEALRAKNNQLNQSNHPTNNLML